MTDTTGDGIIPIGPGTTTSPTSESAPSGDITSISFSATATTLTTTMKIAGLEADPGGANTTATYTVIWDNAQNGKTYATQANLPADPTGTFAYTYGVWDRGTAAYPGTTSTGTGAVVMGTGGTVSVTMPLSGIGSPTIPVTAGNKTAVSDPEGNVIFGEGALLPLVTFTGIVDTAPDAGSGPSWATCAAGGNINGQAVPVGASGTTSVTPPALPDLGAPAAAGLLGLAIIGFQVRRRRR